MMRIFGQKKQKGHAKASSQNVQGSVTIYPEPPVRPKTAPSQTIAGIDRPPLPSRPVRAELAETRQSIQPQWTKKQDSEKWLAAQLLASQQSHPLQTQHPAYRGLRNVEDEIRDAIGEKLSEIISLIDEDGYTGSGQDLIFNFAPPRSPNEPFVPTPITAGSEKTLVDFTIPQSKYQSKGNINQISIRSERTINFLTKISSYSNSSLPLGLPPLRVYIPTWPLFCLAAQYSNTAYQNSAPVDPLDQSSISHIPSNPSMGTKAMVIRSVPCDSKKTIVFAMRGTSVLSPRDWNTNLNTTPTTPIGFLDDAGNLCHAGFLRVARAMVKPIATRIRQLLQQNPSRSECSLLITGHSAGGAVASLLYAHMLSKTVTSELTVLASCFKRLHCISFGAPPISLLPLSKPADPDRRLQKYLFYSFMNEGDPVVRAEKAYVKSLVDLFTSQTPTKEKIRTMGMLTAGLSRFDLGALPSVAQSKERLKRLTTMSNLAHADNSAAAETPKPSKTGAQNAKPTWNLPPSTLSNAGRSIVLRVSPNPTQSQLPIPVDKTAMLKHEFDTVRAEIVTDELLRQVVFGDPLMHGMDVYARRVEHLAMKAVTGRIDVG